MSGTLPKILVRLANESELSQVVTLDRLAFSPSRSNEEVAENWYPQGLNSTGRRQFLAVDESTGAGVGTYAQLELPIFFEKQLFPAVGISGVAVALERRGQKIARLMLSHALEDLRSQQIPLVMLYPFQHGFYRHLGWAWVQNIRRYTVSSQHLPLYSERLNIVAYDAVSHEQALQAVYQQAASNHNGWIQRQPHQWQTRLKPVLGQEIYCYTEADEILGYLIVQLTQPNPESPSAIAVIVHEWVALTPSAYRGILGFLASLRDQVPTVIWKSYPTDPFPHLLKEQQGKSAKRLFGFIHAFGELGGGFMWRLVHLPTAFRLRPINTPSPFTLTFQVADPILGDQRLTIHFAEGRMQVLDPSDQAASGHPKNNSSVVKVSIEHLTALFFGVRRATELAWTEEIELEGDRQLLTHLDTAWQADAPFFWEFF